MRLRSCQSRSVAGTAIQPAGVVPDAGRPSLPGPEPRYRRGETILVEPPEHGFRHGDDVVIELEGEGAFEVGRLLIEGREKLVIEHPRRGNISIERVAIRSTRRIAFVAR